MSDVSDIAENIESVRQRIASAAARAGRCPEEITLIGVTKTVDVGRMREACACGISDFGENYVQEVRGKLEQFPESVHWHFIGHLQTNKARYVAGRFAMVHSVDSFELAVELGTRAARMDTIQPILIEVKLDLADTKFGVTIDQCLSFAERVAAIEGVDLQGFMGMAPYGTAPELARPYFRALRERFEGLPSPHHRGLSMGMTGDFEVAIEEGATHVRIGTAIFGSRSYANS